MSYIVDSIGTEYKEWDGGDLIFISSPTGSGKTTFVLNVLLPFWAQKGQKVLYLVNRTILKEQLNEEVNNLPIDLCSHITIELYQNLEKEISSINYNYLINQKYSKYDCVVCDEAHYFMMDANYNTNTILSYKFINDCFFKKIRIYMSATIENIEKVIRQDIENEKYANKSEWLGYCLKDIDRFGLLRNRKIYNYKTERNYKHIEIGILKNRDEIKNLVISGAEKWLIFVDSKLFGKNLMKDILEGFKSVSKEGSVSFITSDYDLDEEATEVVEAIVTEGKQEPKVLIATSVLDNGITIKDIELRNIIIVADTEIEFVQMLGRKRNDGNSIKLYIYKHDRNHFVKRKRVINQRQRIAIAYYKMIREQIEQSNVTTKQMLDEVERYAISCQHQFWLKKLMNNEVSFEDIKSIFLAVDGCLVLNILSMRNIENLNLYYVALLKKYDTYGEDAFIREQLLWLGKTEEEIQNIITDANKSKYELSRERVIKVLESICDKNISKNEFIEVKKEIASDLLELVEYVGKANDDYKTYYDLCKKGDRVISKPFMEFLKSNCDIPYTVNSGSEKGSYIVQKVEV